MERSLYESRLKAARDEYAQRKWALEKGWEEGKAEGILLGEAKGMQQVFALLEKGMSLEEAKKKLGIL